jgi:DNA-binding response OmpR family regulator
MSLGRLHLAEDEGPHTSLIAVLKREGIEAAIVSPATDLDALLADSPLRLAVVEVDLFPGPDQRVLLQRCAELGLPVIALVRAEHVAGLTDAAGIDDFVIGPPNADEVVTRAKRVLRRREPPEDRDTIRVGDLVINQTSYEVSLMGRRINLRFKEYELLRLLASNPGRVFSRESLLSQVWGYDYFGGTRTVDVHVRRLRSKIEDADHSFIETIWTVGYRFKDLARSS